MDHHVAQQQVRKRRKVPRKQKEASTAVDDFSTPPNVVDAGCGFFVVLWIL